MRCQRQHIEFRALARNISNANTVSIYRVAKKYIDNIEDFNMQENKNLLREDSIDLAILISDICDEIKGCSVYINQIIRSSSSIGANIHEAKYAQSKADFINKMEISLKECSETEYWIELIYRKGKITEHTYKDLRNKCGSIRRRLIASITTAKANEKKEPQK